MNPLRLLLLSMLALSIVSCKKDTEAPVFEVQGDPLECFFVGQPFVETPFIVMDNEDCCLEEQVSVNGSVNTDRYGNYPLVYSVADEAGNLGRLSLDVVVKLDKSNYHGLEFAADDNCDGVNLDYLVSIQDCDCPENAAQLINLGNFGPGAIIDLNFSGEFNEQIAFDKMVGGLHFMGTSNANPTTDSIFLSYSVTDTGGVSQNCELILVRN